MADYLGQAQALAARIDMYKRRDYPIPMDVVTWASDDKRELIFPVKDGISRLIGYNVGRPGADRVYVLNAAEEGIDIQLAVMFPAVGGCQVLYSEGETPEDLQVKEALHPGLYKAFLRDMLRTPAAVGSRATSRSTWRPPLSALQVPDRTGGSLSRESGLPPAQATTVPEARSPAAPGGTK